METVNPRAALLSNFEVLSLLRGLEADHLSRAKTAFRVKNEEEASAAPSSLTIPGNLRTVQVEAISYLSGNYLPNISQKEEGITKLVKDLAAYDLTKAEKLQIVNLAPTRPVELYVIVEELEDRFGEDRIEEILGHVKESLMQSHSDTINSNGINGTLSVQQGSLIVEQDQWDLDADAPYEEDMYDDTGEGAGVEGDLDMEEE